jgi:hypothetical protein
LLDDIVAADDLGFFGDPNAPGGNDVVGDRRG